MANSRKDKEAALVALLEGNLAPLKRLKQENLPLIFVQGEQSSGMFKNVTVRRMTHPQQHIESHELMSEEEFESMKLRLKKKGQPWIEVVCRE